MARRVDRPLCDTRFRKSGSQEGGGVLLVRYSQIGRTRAKESHSLGPWPVIRLKRYRVPRINPWAPGYNDNRSRLFVQRL